MVAIQFPNDGHQLTSASVWHPPEKLGDWTPSLKSWGRFEDRVTHPTTEKKPRITLDQSSKSKANLEMRRMAIS
jgi:hypothetical protein